MQAADLRVALAARDLCVRRRTRASSFELRVDALDLVSGEALAILGPNGAGKSTLLRSLAGLAPLERGSVERRVSRPVTMVFQRPIALAGTVAHNMRAALSSQRLSRSEQAQRASEALAHFGIAKLADRRAATLSGGELRRLALARSFALQPGVLLLDEPFDDLDSAAQESLSLDLRGVIEGTDVAVAVVTHDLRRALLLADRLAVLIDGRIAQYGPREQVLARPNSTAVARLVGMSNLVPARLGTGAGAGLPYAEGPAGHRIPFLAPSAQALARGASVTVGIRPEHLKVDVGRGEGVPIGEGSVASVVSDGVTATVTLDWDGVTLRTYLLAGRGLARSIKPGDRLQLSVRPEDVHVLAADADG